MCLLWAGLLLLLNIGGRSPYTTYYAYHIIRVSSYQISNPTNRKVLVFFYRNMRINNNTKESPQDFQGYLFLKDKTKKGHQSIINIIVLGLNILARCQFTLQSHEKLKFLLYYITKGRISMKNRILVIRRGQNFWYLNWGLKTRLMI